MRNEFRSCFTRRFSLARLVVATVFLAVFVGLNMQKIEPTHDVSYCWGWPLPFAYGGHRPQFDPASGRLTVEQSPENEISIFTATIDVLFALTVLALILFLQTPRRKVAAKEQ